MCLLSSSSLFKIKTVIPVHISSFRTLHACLLGSYLLRLLYFNLAIKGQSSWNPSSMLSRVPGLHPVGGSGSIGFPQFLTMRNSYSSGSTHRSACPHVNKDCPKQCRKADSKRCRVCDCSEIKEKPDSCLDPPTSCPKSCRKRDEKGCKICSCNNEHSGKGQNALHFKNKTDRQTGRQT